MNVNFYKYTFGSTNQLKKLSLGIRNHVRAIMVADEKNSIRLLDKLRAQVSPKDIIKIERVVQEYSFSNESILPSSFPKEPQTQENYNRLKNMGLQKELQIIEVLVEESKARLDKVIALLHELNKAILGKDMHSGGMLLEKFKDENGLSHLLIRKSVLIRILNNSETSIPSVENILRHSGLERNNIFLSSLLHCYNEAQDFLSLKKSMLNLPKRGISNKFTRDICRIPFHPLAKNDDDLAEFLQSCRQFSLLDSIILVKVNRHLIGKYEARLPNLIDLFDKIESADYTIDDVAKMYVDENEKEGDESVFYKHSSAWLEISEIINYRTLIDHFYDASDSKYFEFNSCLLERIGRWAKRGDLSQLKNVSKMTCHNFNNLHVLEDRGTTTRSALFNYFICVNSGKLLISELDLVWIMGRTCDLQKTIEPSNLRVMAKLCSTQLSKLIIYFLIAKKSDNDLDGHTLRKIFQDVVLKFHNGKIINFIEAISKQSSQVAEYAYDVCTEDFIAQLYHIVQSSSETTETRAALHKWMGEHTNEKSYIDRARTLLIDHQLNKIRNEIDDYRIYVDSARFSEWVNDEVMRDLNSVLISLEHKNTLSEADDPQLLQIVEKCYVAFCSNDIFGIASYLGRRIRHGTFKGHLFSSVVSMERDEEYKVLFGDPNFVQKWNRWKVEYERNIDLIIRDRLHIQSSTKRDGVLRVNIDVSVKYDTVAACARNIVRDFSESNSSLGSVQIITEYCWRLAEYDLKEVSTFLKNQKSNLINDERLTDLKNSAHVNRSALAKDFCQTLVRLIDEKLISIYNWFKKPANVSPKASLSLLYKAVVFEVKEVFQDFETGTDFDLNNDVEIVGGAYHVLYDSFYVIVYNAAKHGKSREHLERSFRIVETPGEPVKRLIIEISSTIQDEHTEEYVNKRLAIDPNDIQGAQVSETRSGIRKLYQLQETNCAFSIGNIFCRDRKVVVELIYNLEH